MKRAVLALGSNVRGRWGTPRETLALAVKRLEESDGIVEAVSGVWRSVPFGPVVQPPFLNAAMILWTDLSPHALMKLLRRLEDDAGRRRGRKWGPRALDLDLLDHDGRVITPTGAGRPDGRRALHHLQQRGLILPHPAIALRPFVLLPLAEIAPQWRHPANGSTAAQMLARMPGRIRTQCHRIGAIT